jgi:hypothetical protein
VRIPEPKQVFDDADAHWAFVTAAEDAGFEGQCFDRKEAGRPEADGSAPNAKLAAARGSSPRRAPAGSRPSAARCGAARG